MGSVRQCLRGTEKLLPGLKNEGYREMTKNVEKLKKHSRSTWTSFTY
jgi:hypothetical protein